jgi:hypothetical protein
MKRLAAIAITATLAFVPAVAQMPEGMHQTHRVQVDPIEVECVCPVDPNTPQVCTDLTDQLDKIHKAIGEVPRQVLLQPPCGGGWRYSSGCHDETALDRRHGHAHFDSLALHVVEGDATEEKSRRRWPVVVACTVGGLILNGVAHHNDWWWYDHDDHDNRNTTVIVTKIDCHGKCK